MVQKEKYQQLNAEYYKQEKFSDVVTKRKISKHLSDITDTITEEDIKNVKKCGAYGVILGKALYDGKISVEEVKTLA